MDTHTKTCRSKTLEKFRILKSLVVEPRSGSTRRSHCVGRFGALHHRMKPLLRWRHRHRYLSSSGVLAGGASQVTVLHGAHFIFIRRLEAESALLGFAPVVPGSLGISNLRLRPLIIPLSKLPNIWVCKIGLEISHKHTFPSGISAFVCQWNPGLQKGTEDSALKPKV